MQNTTRDAIMAAHAPGKKAPAQLYLSDIVDLDTLERYIDNGIITRRFNEDKTLEIYKYSKKVGSICPWDEINILFRGLVADTDTGEVVARGFNKFFSIQQYGYFDISVDPEHKAISMPKEDGSMGLACYHNGKWSIATPSAFGSDQAQHATELFRKKYGNATPPVDGTTMIFEIIYSGGRIVTDYGGQDKLVLIGGADKYGKWVNPNDIDFDGDRVETKVTTVQEILDTPDPEDTREGFVFYTEGGLLVKHKFASYLDMHKARFFMTPLFIWEHLKNGDFFEVLSDIPDEFQPDVVKTAKELTKRKDLLLEQMVQATTDMPVELDKKSKALWVKENLDRSTEGILAMQALVAGKDPQPTAWDMIKPVGNKM